MYKSVPVFNAYAVRKLCDRLESILGGDGNTSDCFMLQNPERTIGYADLTALPINTCTVSDKLHVVIKVYFNKLYKS